MKYKVLFSLENNVKVFKNVVCCSLDWRLRVKVIVLKMEKLGFTE